MRNTLEAANHYLREHYLPAFNQKFSAKPTVEGPAFVPYIGPGLDNILCKQYERTVNKDNCVRFEGLSLPVPADRYRRHYVKAKEGVHRYPNGSPALFHGPGRLASYTPEDLSFEPLDQTPANVRCQA